MTDARLAAAVEAAEFERAVDLASSVFGWQHLARYSGMSAEWLDQTLRAIVQSARNSTQEPQKPPQDARAGSGGTPGPCVCVQALRDEAARLDAVSVSCDFEGRPMGGASIRHAADFLEGRA